MLNGNLLDNFLTCLCSVYVNILPKESTKALNFDIKINCPSLSIFNPPKTQPSSHNQQPQRQQKTVAQPRLMVTQSGPLQAEDNILT